MDCSRFQEDMMDVLYGEADAETSARFDAHRGECADCRDELSGLQRVRRDMQAWKFDMPRPRSRYMPGLRGLAAAAAIVIAFTGGLTMANTEIRYREGELVVRFGGGPVRAPQNADLTERLARLEAQQQQQADALRATTPLQPVASTGDAGQDALLRQVQHLVQQSEARQHMRLQAGLSDMATEHQRALMMINTSFSQLQLETASDIERLGNATQNALRISSPGK
jgi:hypothetical protein